MLLLFTLEARHSLQHHNIWYPSWRGHIPHVAACSLKKCSDPLVGSELLQVPVSHTASIRCDSCIPVNPWWWQTCPGSQAWRTGPRLCKPSCRFRAAQRSHQISRNMPAETQASGTLDKKYGKLNLPLVLLYYASNSLTHTLAFTGVFPQLSMLKRSME